MLQVINPGDIIIHEANHAPGRYTVFDRLNQDLSEYLDSESNAQFQPMQVEIDQVWKQQLRP